MIKVVTEEDFDTVYELITALTKDTVYAPVFKNFVLTKEVFQGFLNKPNETLAILVYDEDNNAVGISVFDTMHWERLPPDIKFSKVSYIYVKPEARGKGLGKELNQAFEYWSAKVGVKAMLKGNSGGEGYRKVETVYMKEVN